jgi:hypothetical protein
MPEDEEKNIPPMTISFFEKSFTVFEEKFCDT